MLPLHHVLCISHVYRLIVEYTWHIHGIYMVYTWYILLISGPERYHGYILNKVMMGNIRTGTSPYNQWNIFEYTSYIICAIYSTYTKIPGGSSCASGQGPIPPDPPAMTSPGCVIIALHNIQVRDMPSCCVSTNTVRARAAPARASLRARPARMAAAIKLSSQHVSQYMVLFNLRQAAWLTLNL